MSSPWPQPKNAPKLLAEAKSQCADEQCQRKVLEGSFRQGKRKFGLGLSSERVAVPEVSAIAMILMFMNLEKLLAGSFVLFAFWLKILSSQIRALKGEKSPRSIHTATLWGSLTAKHLIGRFCNHVSSYGFPKKRRESTELYLMHQTVGLYGLL